MPYNMTHITVLKNSHTMLNEKINVHRLSHLNLLFRVSMFLKMLLNNYFHNINWNKEIEKNVYAIKNNVNV